MVFQKERRPLTQQARAQVRQGQEGQLAQHLVLDLEEQLAAACVATLCASSAFKPRRSAKVRAACLILCGFESARGLLNQVSRTESTVVACKSAA